MSRLARLARTLAYPTFFFVAFVFFCYQTFPYPRLRDFLVERIENPTNPAGRRVPSGYEVEILELAPYWLSGVELTGVRLKKNSDVPTERRVAIALPRVVARVSILPLLIGRLRADVELETATGGLEAEATLGFDGTIRAVEAELEAINLHHFHQAGLIGKVPLHGMLGGRVDLDMSDGGANGTLDLSVRNLTVGDGETRVPIPGTVLAGGLTIETIHAGTLQLRGTFTNGTARVERLTARGTDLELRGVGVIRLDRDPRLARLDLFLAARFTEAYQNKSDRTRQMFQLMQANARLRQARASDGSWQLRLRGSPAGQLIPEPAGSERFPSR